MLSAPIHVVVSRYTADRLYDRRLDRIAAPLRRAAALTVVGFALIGIALVVLMRLPLALALVGAPLTAVIGAQWLMLSVGGGMMSPVVLLRAFGVGAPLSLIAALAVERAAPAGGAGYLFGFAAGQLITLALLVRGVARALPADADESARLWPAFVEYRLLALSAFAYYVSIWADKIVVYIVKGGDVAAFYAAIAAVAWFSVIPAFAWIYVQVETAFYQRFRSFYAELEAGASLRELKQHAELISTEAKRILRGAAAVQVGATMLVIAAAPRIVADRRSVTRRDTAVPPGGAGRGPAGLLAAGGAAADVLRPQARRAHDLWLPARRRHRADRHLQRDRLAARDRSPDRLRDQLAARSRAGAPPPADAGAGHLPVTAIRRRLSRFRRPGAPRSPATARRRRLLPGSTAASESTTSCARVERLAAAVMMDRPRDVSGAGVPFQLLQRAQRVGVRQIEELRARQLVPVNHVLSSPSSAASLAIASFTRILTVPSGLAVFAAISLWLRPSK